MEYILIFIGLFLMELIYFKIADWFNIIDKPNLRSSHTQITLRGGGVIFYLALLLYSIVYNFPYPYFLIGCTAIAAISFLDDVFTLSNKIRIAIHAFAIVALFFEVQIFQLPLVWIPISFILGIGIFNAYNFMDGINGITASYSLAVLALLGYCQQLFPFIEDNVLLYLGISVMVFAFFNFRNKAKTFAGDVGSMTMAYALVFALALLIIKTKNPVFIMFLSVYGIDTMLTILERIKRKENIFEAHRLHLYQLLANEAKGNRLAIALAYSIIQVLVGLVVIAFADQGIATQIAISVSILGVLILVYCILKRYIKRKFMLE